MVLRADVNLPAVFSDHMVLQRRMPSRIWGTASPGEKISLALDSSRASAVANAEGRWSAALPPHEAGGPYELTISGLNSVAVHDVLVGEVWVASGQSNMVLQISRANNAGEEIANAKYSRIRFFQTPTKVAEAPAGDVNGQWRICAPDVAKGFSAVAYFFARELSRYYDVPFGIIESAVGGTPAEAWTSMPALKAEPLLHVYLDNWQKTLENYPAALARFEEQKKNVKPGATAPRPPRGPGNSSTPSGLYNGMIAPFVGYGIRGAIWYQGEANAGGGVLYHRLFETMIRDWREAWGQGEFPFLYAQLPNYRKNDGWAELQDSQRRTLGLRNTGMAITIDIGDPTNIHPTGKVDVGNRMARVARAVVYGERITYSGPLFREVTHEVGALRVWFEQTGGSLKTKDGGAVKAFEIAGADGKYVPATAKIEKDTVVVSSIEVAEPVAVRYAWGGSPEVNLYNSEDLPASPFKSTH